MKIGSFFCSAAVLSIAALPHNALAFDELVPGKAFMAKPDGKLVKFIAKAPNPPLFQLPTSDPSGVTTTLRVLDAGGAGGDDTYSLDAGIWKGLGNPAGSKGWKYKGAGTASDPCKVVVITEKVVKAVCKDKGAGGIALTTPFSGNGQIVLTVGSDRYCGEWGGTEKKNDDKLIKRKASPPPASCAWPKCPCFDAEDITSSGETSCLKDELHTEFPCGAFFCSLTDSAFTTSSGAKFGAQYTQSGTGQLNSDGSYTLIETTYSDGVCHLPFGSFGITGEEAVACASEIKDAVGPCAD